MRQNFTNYTFTDSVKTAQEKYGSREIYKKVETNGPDQYQIFQREIAHIQRQDSFYMATVGENGWPYVQFRGGPKGFLKIIDQETLGYADFRGNMQYISTGNIEAGKMKDFENFGIGEQAHEIGCVVFPVLELHQVDFTVAG